MVDYESESKVFYKVEDLIKRWKKEGVKEGQRGRKAINQKIKKCFQEIGFEIILDWYRTETPGGERKEFIFRGNNAPNVIRYLFLICDEYDRAIKKDEIEELKKGLVEILPMYRDSGAKKKIDEFTEKSLNPIHKYMEDKGTSTDEDEFAIKTKIVRMFVDDFYYKVDKKQVFKERFFDPANDIYRGEEEKKIGGQMVFFTQEFQWVKKWHSRWCMIMDFTEKMRRLERFANIHDECEKNKIKESVRKKFYESGIVENEDMEKIIENSDWMSSKHFCKEVLKLKRNADLKESDNGEERINDIETCYKKCKELVDSIVDRNLNIESVPDSIAVALKRILKDRYGKNPQDIEDAGLLDFLDEHESLEEFIIETQNYLYPQYIFKEDYRYMLEEAFKDLEDVYLRVNLEKNRSRYKACFKGGEIEDFNDFMSIRTAVYNRKICLKDYLETRKE